MFAPGGCPIDQLDFDTDSELFKYKEPGDDCESEILVLGEEHHRDVGRVIVFGTTGSVSCLVRPNIWHQNKCIIELRLQH